VKPITFSTIHRKFSTESVSDRNLKNRSVFDTLRKQKKLGWSTFPIRSAAVHRRRPSDDQSAEEHTYHRRAGWRTDDGRGRDRGRREADCSADDPWHGTGGDRSVTWSDKRCQRRTGGVPSNVTTAVTCFTTRSPAARHPSMLLLLLQEFLHDGCGVLDDR